MKYFTITEIILVILLILLITLIFSNLNLTKEGFNNDKIIQRFKGANIFDDEYISIYDDLFYNNTKNKYEINNIIKTTNPSKNSKLLDIGCGTGHHVDLFNKKNIKSIGIDISPIMIKKAQKNYPENKYKLGNVLNSIEFPPNTFFSYYLSYIFTIYYIKKKRLFFGNCFNWLIPGGILILHLVNINKFDPVLPSSIV